MLQAGGAGLPGIALATPGELQNKAAEKTVLTKAWVLDRLKEVVERNHVLTRPWVGAQSRGLGKRPPPAAAYQLQAIVDLNPSVHKGWGSILPISRRWRGARPWF